jgi:DNA-binding response OmpR family regulator
MKLAPVRILVVDDEPAVRRAVRRALTLEGYEVRVAWPLSRSTRSCSTC